MGDGRRSTAEPGFLSGFHAGDPEVLAGVYEEHYATVERAISRLIPEVDRETVIHEVFFRLVSSADHRRSFQGGSLAAWLSVVGRNQAIDVLRRQRRDPVMSAQAVTAGEGITPAGWDEALEARLVIERFRREVLPAKWAGVFQTRFLEQLDQREAARRLGIARTTLVYQEMRVRRLLERFVLDEPGLLQPEPGTAATGEP